MKRTHTKLRGLIKADAKNNVGGLGAILEMIATPSSGEAPLANLPFNKAYGQFLFGGECDVSALFESLLRKLPEENAGDLAKLFMLAYFKGMTGAGRELAIDEQRYIQKEIARRHGKKGSEGRSEDAKEKWEDDALAVALEYQKQYPCRGQTWLAKEIMEKLGDNAPGERQIKKKLSLWQKQGKLKRVKRVRPSVF